MKNLIKNLSVTLFAIMVLVSCVGNTKTSEVVMETIEDIDPMPGTKKFNSELLNAEAKYKRLKRKKEEYDDTLRKVR